MPPDLAAALPTFGVSLTGAGGGSSSLSSMSPSSDVSSAGFDGLDFEGACGWGSVDPEK